MIYRIIYGDNEIDIARDDDGKQTLLFTITFTEGLRALTDADRIEIVKKIMLEI